MLVGPWLVEAEVSDGSFDLDAKWVSLLTGEDHWSVAHHVDAEGPVHKETVETTGILAGIATLWPYCGCK